MSDYCSPSQIFCCYSDLALSISLKREFGSQTRASYSVRGSGFTDISQQTWINKFCSSDTFRPENYIHRAAISELMSELRNVLNAALQICLSSGIVP